MPAPAQRCEVCGATLTTPSSGRAGRPARFCSSACRQRAYRRRSAGDPVMSAATSEAAVGSAGPDPPPPRSTLPAPLDSFVGREKDLDELAGLMGRHRLVTLLGPGGAGKTRLALEHARRSGGALWVELASLADPALLAHTVADSLHIGEEIGRPVFDTLVDRLVTALSVTTTASATTGLPAGPPVLLILDNCEHLVAATAGFAEQLLRRCPTLRILVTSRESLEIAGEAVFRVGELSLPPLLPPSIRDWDAAHVLASDAVRLFVERARASAPDFALSDDNAPHVAAICAHLDGIPLAIELAARRIRLFPVVEIRARLDDRFRLLTAGPRTAARRHRDLRATIEWSYDLLDPAEQAVFRRLSIFVGGFGLATATAVVCGRDADEADADDMLEMLTALEARSLIVPDAAGGSGRFRQLESIRLYGREQLRAAGEEDGALDRLATYLVDLAEPIVGDGMLHCYEELQPLDVERANLLALVDWAARRRDARHLLLATALGRCWRHQGYVSDGWAMLRTALEAADPDHPGRPAALNVAAGLVGIGGDHEQALMLAGEAVDLEERIGHPVRLAKAYSTLASVHIGGGEGERASAAAELALALEPRLKDPLDLAVCLHNQAYHLLQSGHADRASELMVRCLPMYRANSPHPLPPEWLHSAGMLALARGEIDAADTHFREGLERYQTVDRADELPVIAVNMFEGLAVVAAVRGEYVRALRLDGVAETARVNRKLGREAAVERQRETALEAARAGLTVERAEAAEAAGGSLTARQAVRYAIDGTWEHAPNRSPLSQREHDVARLVADGMTNRQIASRLRLTERAVESMLRSIRTRLHLRSRAQLAAWSVEHSDDE